ncbi:MAG: ATP-binding protein [Flavobacteriales bacterium]
MPHEAYSRERDERRLLVVLYVGTLVLLVILLYATYANVRRYNDSVTSIRRYNYALIELTDIFSDLQDQETSARGYLLTREPSFLEPYEAGRGRDSIRFHRMDSLLDNAGWHAQLDMLRIKYDRVQHLLAEQLADTVGVRSPRSDVAGLDRSKVAMDEVRMMHALMMAQLRMERETYLSNERRDGLDAPITLIFYSLLAIAATALLFWRLSRSLRNTEHAKLDLRIKLAELDKEVLTRTSIQDMLENVLDISPNGIMAFRSIHDQAGTIVDFEFLSSNRQANVILKRDDLIGKRLLTEMPENGPTGLFDAYVNVVKTGLPYQNEFYYQGEGISSWFSSHAVRLEDGFMVTFSDITEQKRAQEVNAEADRIALTGQITRTVAHEVRNPLTNIHLAVEQMHDEVQDREELVRPFFQIIDRNLKRIGTLINGMLESTRQRELKLGACALKDIVTGAMDHVADRLVLKEVKGEMDIAPDLPSVMVDHDLINLAITNIAINAVEAMEPGKGRLRMHAYRVRGEVLLEISDNGKGIPAENLDRLFLPFYSGRAGGLGLGLTTTRSILNSHRIKLEVRSAVGEGTTFTLRFPPDVFAPGS